MATQYWHLHKPAPHRLSIIPIAGVSGTALLFGRFIFGGYFLFASIHHFTQTAQLAAYAASRGVPLPYVAVLGAGALILAGGLGVLTGLYPRLGAALIALFLVGVTPVMHAFWADPVGPARDADVINFTKNLGLLGGALIAFAVVEPRVTGQTIRIDEATGLA